MKIKCGCKINLYLRITGKREDGYHNLDTVFIPLNTPYDIVTIKKQKSLSKKERKAKALIKLKQKFAKNVSRAHSLQIARIQNTKVQEQNNAQIQKITDKKKSGIKVFCKTQGIDPANNTLTKAYHLYRQETGFAPKIRIHLKKGIPHGAGLGGGSSNAAALLSYLQKKNPSPLPLEKLIKVAAGVGADVPFFLYNTPCHAKGIGEVLQPINLANVCQSKEYRREKEKKKDTINRKKQNDEKGICLLLISPYIQISTHEAFQYLDNEKKDLTKKASLDKYQLSCFLKDFVLENDFENSVIARHPLIGQLKTALLEQGAFVALLSGTGSSLFGLFENKKTAKKAKKYLQKIFCVKNEVSAKKQKSSLAKQGESQENINAIRLYSPVKIT